MFKCAVDAEVVSVDAITKEGGGVIVGVTLIKVFALCVWSDAMPLMICTSGQADADVKEVYFNIYGIHCEPALPVQWSRIAGAALVCTVC